MMINYPTLSYAQSLLTQQKAPMDCSCQSYRRCSANAAHSRQLNTLPRHQCVFSHHRTHLRKPHTRVDVI